MGRLTTITGEFMGVRFEVKPTPINFDEVDEKARTMLRDWYKENYPETYKKLDNPDLSIEDYNDEDVKALNAWVKDVDFRASYLQFKANASMKFSKPLQDEIWKSDDLELSTIEEAWDFFTKRRSVPSNGVKAL